MKATQRLHDVGQSLWLDNITRGLLTGGTLRRYIDELAITGLTSNPTIFDHAIGQTDLYDDAIQRKLREGKSGDRLFFELALKTSPRRPTSSGRSTTRPAGETAGSRWRCRRFSPTTRRARWTRRGPSTARRGHYLAAADAYLRGIERRMNRIIPELAAEAEPRLHHDSSTNRLIQRYRKLRRGAT